MTKNGWIKTGNTYRNADPKYAEIEIQNWGSSTWAVMTKGTIASTRTTLKDAKILAAYWANEWAKL